MWDFNSNSFLDALVWMFLVFIWIAFIFIWFRCVIDLFRDHGMGGGAEFLWVYLLLLCAGSRCSST